MSEVEIKLEEYKTLMGKTDSESVLRQDEIYEWLKQHDSAESQELVSEFIERGLAEIRVDIDNIRKQIDTEYNILPISYIARHYFGKSRSWLFQRINGNKVRGKVYTLNDEQKATFNAAVQDIAKRISAVRLV